jgi:hypothetical protein
VPKNCPSAADVMANLQLASLVLGSGDPSMCEYLFNGSESAPYVVITFTYAPGITAAVFESGLKGGQADVKAVAGVGDVAFSFAGISDGVGLSLLSGSTACSIVTTVPSTTAGEVSLAQKILTG